MPAEMALHPTEKPVRQVPEIPDLFINIIFIFRKLIRENMVYKHIGNGKAAKQPAADVFFSVTKSYGGTDLGFGIFRHQFPGFPKLSVAEPYNHPQNFPGKKVIDHNLKLPAGF